MYNASINTPSTDVTQHNLTVTACPNLLRIDIFCLSVYTAFAECLWVKVPSPGYELCPSHFVQIFHAFTTSQFHYTE